MPNRLLLLRASLEDFPSQHRAPCVRIRFRDNVDALQQRYSRNTTRVAGQLHFMALRDIFHTRARVQTATSGSVVLF